MKSKIISCLILLALSLNIFAQQETSVRLKNISDRLEKDCGISATLEFTDNTSYAVFSENAKGSIKIDKECFVIDAIIFRIWFDGTTLWTMQNMNGYEEIYITSPDKEDLANINPLLFLKQPGLTVKQGNKNGHLETVEITSNALVIGNFNLQIAISYNPDDYRMKQLVAMDRYNTQTSIDIRITEYKTGLEFNKNDFQCPTSNYPDAEIVDMR